MSFSLELLLFICDNAHESNYWSGKSNFPGFFLAEIDTSSQLLCSLTSFSLHLQLRCLTSHSWF